MLDVSNVSCLEGGGWGVLNTFLICVIWCFELVLPRRLMKVASDCLSSAEHLEHMVYPLEAGPAAGPTPAPAPEPGATPPPAPAPAPAAGPTPAPAPEQASD